MKQRAIAAWAVATLLAGCASMVVPQWPDGAVGAVCHLMDGTTCGSDRVECRTADGCYRCHCDPMTLQATCTLDTIACPIAGRSDAGDVTQTPDAPPSDAGTGPCILPSNGMPCPVGSTCSDGHCGACTCARSDLLLCTGPHSCPIFTVCMNDNACAGLAGTTCQFPTNYCGGHGVCGTPGMCGGGQMYCGCDGQSYIPANGRCEPDRPTVHPGPCEGPPPPACTLPSGAMCPANTTCPAGDSCNNCFCGNDGTATCSTTGCDPNPVRTCGAASQCRAGEICQFYTLGCDALGQCVPRVACSETTAFCGCHGTYTDCVMSQPTLLQGACGG